MGCDIHTMAEYNADRYVPSEEPGKGGHFEPDPDKWKAIKVDVFPAAYFYEDQPVSRYNMDRSSAPYSGRNYLLFSLLANVRNSRMRDIFGPGSPLYMDNLERDMIEPLAEPRGVPENASKTWRKTVERWGADLHSTSWFTVQELLDFQAAGKFDQTIHQRGWVSLKSYLEHKENGTPIESWSTAIGGGGVRTIHEAEWITLDAKEKEELIAAARAEEFPAMFSQINIGYEWDWQLTDAVSEFVEKTIPALQANAPRKWNPEYGALQTYAERRDFEGPRHLYEYDRIRIVFGFDN
jgi:hypothetical protein